MRQYANINYVSYNIYVIEHKNTCHVALCLSCQSWLDREQLVIIQPQNGTQLLCIVFNNRLASNERGQIGL